MKKYKGLFVPPVGVDIVDIEDIRYAYCKGGNRMYGGKLLQ